MSIEIKTPELERIAAALERIAAALEKHSAPVALPAEAHAQIGESVKPAPVAPAEPPQSVPVEPAANVSQNPESAQETPHESAQPRPAVTIDQIRKLVVTLSANGKKPQVREIVTAYGANVSAIPADKYAEVVEKLTALKGA